MPRYKKDINYFNKYNVLLTLAILIFSLLPSPFKIFSLLLFPFLFIKYWPLINKASVFLNYVFYFIINISLLTIVGIIFWIFDLRLTTFTGSLSIAVLVYATSTIILKHKNSLSIGLLNKDDIFSILITLLVCIPFILATFSNGYSVGLIKDATHGFDNAQHTSLTYSLYENQGYIYGSSEDTTDTLVYSDRGEYPKASHLITSYFWRAFSNDLSIQNNPIQVMAFYYFGKLFMLMLTIFLFSRLLFLLSSKRKYTNNFYDFFIISILTLFSTIVYFLTNLSFGFAPFIFTTLLVLFSVFHLLNRTGYKSDIIIGSIILTASTFSWLLSVVYFGLYFIYLVFSLDDINKPRFYKILKTNSLTYLLAASIVSLSLLQLYFQLKYSVKPGNINDDGGITNLSSLFILIVILISSIIYYLTKQYRLLIEFSYLIYSAAILSGLIYLYQIVTIDRTAYFYTKSLGILACIVLVFFASSLHYLVNHIKKYSNILISTVIFVGFLVMITSLTQINLTGSVKYYFGLRSMSTETAITVSEQLNYIANIKPLVVINKNQNSEEDVIGTIYLNMITREHKGCRSQVISHQIFNRQNTDELQDILSFCNQNYKILKISD